jgi:hypothetical protein
MTLVARSGGVRKTWLRRALAVGAVFVACANPSAQATPNTGTTVAAPGARKPNAAARALFGESIGLHVKFNEGEPESDLLALDDLGVRWVRDSVPWHKMEPSPGDFRDFPPEFARRLTFYRDHGIGLVFILAFANDVAYPRTAAEPFRSIDPALYARYAVQVAERLRKAGVRFVLEIWNEPHHFTVRDVAGGNWNGAPPSPWVAHYVRMVGEVTRRIKAFDPSIVLLDDDDMWVLHYRFLEAGLPAKLDGFAFHPYTRHQPSASASSWFPPEHTAIAADTPWVRPFVAVDADSSFESAVRRLRDAGTRSLASPPQMWVTEWGFKLGDDSSDGTLDESLVAAYLPRAYILAANAGVRTVCWFSSEDRNDGPWGLIDNDGHRRKPYYALRTLTRQLGELSFVGRVAGFGHRTAGPQAFLFCRANVSCTLVAWSIGDRAARIRLGGPLSGASAVDFLGEPMAPGANSDGAPTLSIDRSPVYFTGLPGRTTASSTFTHTIESLFE